MSASERFPNSIFKHSIFEKLSGAHVFEKLFSTVREGDYQPWRLSRFHYYY